MPSSVGFHDVSVAAPNGQRILEHFDLAIAGGEAIALIGRSGAGKTTALRLINGLAAVERGEVTIDGESLRRIDLIAHRRRCGYIIQGAGLLPHRSVYENIAVVPRLLNWKEERTRAAAVELLERVGLPIDRFGERKPRSLSGGEQQRVGIVRALIAGPSILLCDEPFGALDPIVRRELQDLFRSLRADATIVFVTHDVAEALRIARRIILIDRGRIVVDSTAEAFPRHDHPLVRSFVDASALDVA